MPQITPLPFNAAPVNFVRLQPGQEADPGIWKGDDEWLEQIWTHCARSGPLPIYMVIDGTHGAAFGECLKRLRSRCRQENRVLIEIDSADYLQSSADLLARFHPYLTDNRTFGVVASDVSVADYFRPHAQEDWLREAERQLRLHGLDDSAEDAETWLPKTDQLALTAQPASTSQPVSTTQLGSMAPPASTTQSATRAMSVSTTQSVSRTQSAPMAQSASTTQSAPMAQSASMAPPAPTNLSATMGTQSDSMLPASPVVPKASAASAVPASEPPLAPVVVTSGPGAAFLSAASGAADVALFCDVSRETQQHLHRQGMGALGLGPCRDTVETYKQALFLEWPVWEEYRKRRLYDFDYYMDMNNREQPVLVTIPLLRRLLASAARQPFRVKPFFAPGIWGGQYLKKLCGLPPEWDNCAWGFEPIAPENTLLIGCKNCILEFPFPLLLSAHPEIILGERNVRLFGDYFPIRFDYLDTIDGDHLSLQVHPRQAYIEQTFNETMTQQESYYIMEQKQQEGAKPFVALGFTEGTTGEQLLQAVESAHASGEPLKIEEYVNVMDAHKGDLFLIPPGAVHFLGKNNLVLEISSTTWWFTFKIYDHLRLDKDGRPRPINGDHAGANMQEQFDTGYVREHLAAVPRERRTQGASSEELLGEREDLLFQVKRLKLDGEWIDDTGGEFVMFNLVEGGRVRLTPLADEDAAVQWGYAEAYIVPASVGGFRLESLGGRPCTLIRAQVSPGWDTPLLPHHWKSGERL